MRIIVLPVGRCRFLEENESGLRSRRNKMGRFTECTTPYNRPSCWCPSRWAPAWRLHTNLYKFGENVFPHIFHKKNCCGLNLGESLNTSTFFLFPDSRLNLLNGFYFFILIYLEWRDTENHQYQGLKLLICKG